MKLRHLIKNEKGIALVMVLVLSAISLAIMSVLIFMITSGTKISGAEKRYLNALEAAYGAAEDVTGGGGSGSGGGGGGGGQVPEDENMLSDIKAGSFNPADYNNFNYSPSSPAACVQQKVNSNASAANWAACGSFANVTIKIDPTDNTTYDYRFDVPAITPTHRAFVKIINSGMGNTVRKVLRTGSVTSLRQGSFLPPITSSYTFEILTVNLANPDDRARLSFLFAQ